ncbi:hypothetical protein ESY86_16775 [Subsaximicrobium wynnwilliamsii]|jgi:hypothetical protein|uniref:Addiction module protein n=1 Tax=Subsaximicrobium wynnwilliamsii TaxID=291179 RepID=A0A5C6ZBN8_9FLAO|nr:hypothetical protein [Subsaximicrobium wynnwilliamsii]TXD81678.1 hypothetical protein ESY87_17030 [Subsaximicrobium wynnwilliamsii]TXD87433.1 hypothetical protein ESY86_16775 [Subsaximicrobium wynnwilliamsii]TXE01121.1 hypothetical protein ESY88_17030 [Subsaximicrobium wynnwilliamsii]
MNLETRKIEFVQEFLKLQSEDAIARLEKLLEQQKMTPDQKRVAPMTQAELNKRIDQSESDFLNNRYKSSAELLAKYE